MTTTYAGSKNEICAVFNAAWTANSAAIAGYVPDVRWPGIEYPNLPDASKFWARLSIQTVFEEQTALAGSDLKRRYTASGLVFVQLFCPKSLGDVDTLGRLLAEVARNSFRGKSTENAVWFRNARINDNLESEALYHRLNVVAEFEYDEIG